MAAPARFPPDWLESPSGDAASDLDLVVLLINSYDSLDDPPDRLQDLRWWRAVLGDVGHAALADEIADDDLMPLRDLRTTLRQVFEARTTAAAAEPLNRALAAADAVPLLVPAPEADERLRLEVGADRRGLAALQARLPMALAQHLERHGIGRLGTCASDPCHCAFVDRTRGATKRYCCTWCNDRAAARAYRKRHKKGLKS